MRSTCLETWYEPYLRKDGKSGHLVMHCAEYSPFRQCRRCGVWGSPRRVQYRTLCYHTEKRVEPIYCMGCWNVVRQVVRREEDAVFAAYAAGKIKREARKYGNEKR